MKILIIGSGGMLGTDLGRVLSETKKHQIYGLDTRISNVKEKAVLDGFIETDITKDEEVLKSIVGLNPELIIHTAAWTDVDACELNPEKAELTNAVGTRNIALACRQTGAGFFYISTDYVFDGRKQQPYTEEDQPGPISVYGRTKLAGENYVKEILENYVIIRSSWLFGSNGSNFVRAILNKAGDHNTCRELKIVDDQRGSPTYTLDLAAGIKELIDRFFLPRSPDSGEAKPGIYNITNSGVCSWYDLACKAVEYAGIKGVQIKPISTAKLNPPRPAPRPEMSALDNSRYNRLIGRLLRPWSEALKSYIMLGGNK